MARPSAIEVSPFRKEIEEMIKEGKPDLYIASWLKEKEAPITRQTISKYRNNQFNITEDTRRKYAEQQTKERLSDASDLQINDLKIIDEIVSQVDPEVMKDMMPKDQIKAIPQLLNTKYKILGVIDGNKEINVKVDGSVEHNITFNQKLQDEILEDNGYDK
jgi:hypothetical protein